MPDNSVDISNKQNFLFEGIERTQQVNVLRIRISKLNISTKESENPKVDYLVWMKYAN